MTAEPFVPTPEDIAREAAAIRAEWDAETERSRRAAGCRRVEWRLPGMDRNREITDRDTDRDG